VRWALLSDPNIAADPNDTYRGFKPTENFRKVVDQVKAAPFARMRRPRCREDRAPRSPSRRSWLLPWASGPLQFVLLDSLLATNIALGQLGKARRDWLAGYLAVNAARPTVIVVHHNPDGAGDKALVDADRRTEGPEATHRDGRGKTVRASLYS
jgi:hypothetical protein